MGSLEDQEKHKNCFSYWKKYDHIIVDDFRKFSLKCLGDDAQGEDKRKAWKDLMKSENSEFQKSDLEHAFQLELKSMDDDISGSKKNYVNKMMMGEGKKKYIT